MFKVGEIIDELNLKNDSTIYVIVGSSGELEFLSDSIGDGVIVWNTLMGNKEDLTSISEYLENNPNFIPEDQLEFPEEPDRFFEDEEIPF